MMGDDGSNMGGGQSDMLMHQQFLADRQGDQMPMQLSTNGEQNYGQGGGPDQ